MLEITVDIFSGRPNPTWTVANEEALPLLKDIAHQRDLLARPDEARPVLGFRGVVFALDKELVQQTGLPPSFRLAAGLTDREEDALALARRAVDLMPLETTAATPERPTPLTSELLAFLKEGLQRINAPGFKTSALAEIPPQPTAEEAMIDGNCRYEVGAFDPALWNSSAHILYNNCYNFGTNRCWDNFAQPGYAGGAPASYPFSCANVTTGAASDGLRVRGRCASAGDKPRYFVALAVYPDGWDYHWWRQCIGYWAHKPGRAAATNLDSSGRIITNPETCDRGRYTTFCGYLYVPRHINLKG